MSSKEHEELKKEILKTIDAKLGKEIEKKVKIIKKNKKCQCWRGRF
jgi:hypothetical protein